MSINLHLYSLCAIHFWTPVLAFTIHCVRRQPVFLFCKRIVFLTHSFATGGITFLNTSTSLLYQPLPFCDTVPSERKSTAITHPNHLSRLTIPHALTTTYHAITTSPPTPPTPSRCHLHPLKLGFLHVTGLLQMARHRSNNSRLFDPNLNPDLLRALFVLRKGLLLRLSVLLQCVLSFTARETRRWRRIRETAAHALSVPVPRADVYGRANGEV